MQAYDSIQSILHHVDTIQHLGLLACTSKKIRTHIDAKMWNKAGEKLCGQEYWSENNNPLVIKARICPWMTQPKEIELAILNSIKVLGGTYNFKGIQVVNQTCNIALMLRGTVPLGFMRDNPCNVVVSTDAYGETVHLDSIRRQQMNWPTQTTDELILLNDLNRTNWRPLSLYGTTITAVRIVHDGLFCAFSPEDNSDFVIMYFASTKTRSVVHTHR